LLLKRRNNVFWNDSTLIVCIFLLTCLCFILFGFFALFRVLFEEIKGLLQVFELKFINNFDVFGRSGRSDFTAKVEWLSVKALALGFIISVTVAFALEEKPSGTEEIVLFSV